MNAKGDRSLQRLGLFVLRKSLPWPWPWPWASIFGDQPDDYYEAKDALNQLAGKSMRLEARIVKNVMDGCREEGSHE